MHTVGKVFLGLTIVAAIGVIVLSGKLLTKRNNWTQKLDALKKDNERLASELVAKRAELRQLKQDYEQEMLPWQTYFDKRNANPPQPDGTVAVQAGTNDGVGVPATAEKPVVHYFYPTADGTGSVYAGPFQASSLTETSISAKPTWRARPSEIAQWKGGAEWRVRTLVPPVWVNNFNRLQDELTRGEETLVERQQTLAVQTAQVKQAESQLKQRQEELLGSENPNPKAADLPAEFTKGLQAALAEEDEARAADLAKVDELRRAVQQEFRRQEELIDKNRRLAGSLPGAAPQTPAAAPAVSGKTTAPAN